MRYHHEIKQGQKMKAKEVMKEMFDSSVRARKDSRMMGEKSTAREQMLQVHQAQVQQGHPANKPEALTLPTFP